MLAISNTKDTSCSTVSILGYGVSGAGKTRVLCSLPNPLIIATEDGLLSARDLEVDALHPTSWEELLQITQGLKTKANAEEMSIEWAGKKYSSVVIDSLTELHVIVMRGVLKLNRRDLPLIQDWGLAGDRVETFVRDILRLPVHVGATALEQIDKDELTGKIMASIMVPGRLSRKLPALFDEVFHFRTEAKQDGSVQRVVLTSPDSIYIGRDRSGLLEKFEPIQLKDPKSNELWKKLGIIN